MEQLLLWTFDPRHMQSFTETSFVSPDKSCSKAGRSYYTWRQRSLQQAEAITLGDKEASRGDERHGAVSGRD